MVFFRINLLLIKPSTILLTQGGDTFFSIKSWFFRSLVKIFRTLGTILTCVNTIKYIYN